MQPLRWRKSCQSKKLSAFYSQSLVNEPHHPSSHVVEVVPGMATCLGREVNFVRNAKGGHFLVEAIIPAKPCGIPWIDAKENLRPILAGITSHITPILPHP